jgi:hypothetical protein
MTRLTFLLLPALLLLGGCKKDSATDPGTAKKAIDALLVKNGEISGWTYAGAAWVANNLSELTTYINGAADTYQRHGFVEAAHQEYAGSIGSTGAQIKVTVYNQASASNAAALYADPALGFTGAVEWTGGAGTAAHYVRINGVAQMLSFHRDGYYVYLELLNVDTDQSLNVLKGFASNIDGKITNG